MLLHYTIAISVLSVAYGNANIYSDAVQELTISSVKFGINLYKELISDEKSANVIFSPVSVSSALAMTKLGAKGNSSGQINDVLELDKIEAGLLSSTFAELNGLLFDKPKSNITLEGASCAFVSNNRRILKDYKNALTTFGATIAELDFVAGIDESVKKINKWISDKTDGLIPDMLTKDSITADTALMLVSTLYFSGEWHSGFNPKQTEEREFYFSHYRIIKTPFMYQRGKFKFRYIESLTLQVLEMPYVNQEISMIILLPDNFDLSTVERNLNYDNLTNWLSSTQYESVDLTFPKFKLNQMTDLKSTLQRMGIKDIFDGEADLSGMTSDKTLYIDEIMHKGVLEVTYAGEKVEAERSEANRTPSAERKVVYADHPFIFLVKNTKTNVIYLMGALKRPAGVERGHDEL